MRLEEHCGKDIPVTEKDIDFDFYTLKQAGIWCVDVETENYKFNFYSNDMDPHLWFGNANRKPGDGYNHAFYPGNKSHYSTLYDAEDCTPLEIIEKHYEGETANVVAITTNKPTLSLEDAITFGTCAIVKKDPLQRIGFKSEADRMLTRAILDAADTVVKEYNLKIDQPDGSHGRIMYPDTYGLPNQGKEIVARGVELAVANFKAAKKAKAAAKKAKAAGLSESKLNEDDAAVNDIYEYIHRSRYGDADFRRCRSVDEIADYIFDLDMGYDEDDVYTAARWLYDDVMAE